MSHAERIASILRERITSGEAGPPGTRLPTTKQLARFYDVGRPTVSAVMKILASEQLIRMESPRNGWHIARHEGARMLGPDSSECQPEEIAAAALNRTLRAVVMATHGMTAFTDQPIFSVTHSTEPAPEPAAALRAALLIRALAGREVHRAVSRLRGAGRSWDDIAGPAGSGEESAQVFEEVADLGGEFGSPQLSWRCDSCGSRIRDLGPAADDPRQAERGHADDCARHAADIQHYEEQRHL